MAKDPSIVQISSTADTASPITPKIGICPAFAMKRPRYSRIASPISGTRFLTSAVWIRSCSALKAGKAEKMAKPMVIIGTMASSEV